MTDTAFSLDIGEKFFRVCDAVTKDGKIQINALGYESTVSNFYSDDTEKSIDIQSELIAKSVNDLKIAKRNVHVVIPDTFTFFQILELSKLNEKETLSAVRYQADQFIPLPIDEVVLDVEVLREDKVNKTNTLLIVASPKKLVERVEQTVEGAGLIPDTLENELSAVGRFYQEIMKVTPNNAYLIVNMGFSSSSLYLIEGATSLILASRTVKIGLDLFLKELKFNLELQETKAIEVLKKAGFEKNPNYDVGTIVAPLVRELVGEISKFTISAKEKYNLPTNKVFFFNYGGSVLSLDRKLTELLGIPVELLNLKDLLIENPITQAFAPEMSSFIGALAAGIR